MIKILIIFGFRFFICVLLFSPQGPCRRQVGGFGEWKGVLSVYNLFTASLSVL